jgi:IclR family acetate operon transcriptional repressor
MTAQASKSHPQPRRPEGRLTHRSLERGLQVLEIVAAHGSQIGLAEIARRAGLHRSTGHHLLRTLVGLGYLHQDPETRSYEVAEKLHQLTARGWTPEQMSAIAQPTVTELARVSGEGASFAAYLAGEVTLIVKCGDDGIARPLQGPQVVRPIHASAVGKAIAAFLPSPELDDILDRIDYERYTPNTIIRRDALEREFQRIRAGGCATDDEEHIEGIRCVAAPVHTYTGRVVASLCAVGPKSRMTHQKLNELRTPLVTLARAVSRRLGASDRPGNRYATA